MFTRPRRGHFEKRSTCLLDGGENVGLAVVVTVSADTEVDLLLEGILRT
jgi:hypothetical protein